MSVSRLDKNQQGQDLAFIIEARMLLMLEYNPPAPSGSGQEACPKHMMLTHEPIVKPRRRA
jgi:hypothetical protein